MCGRVLDERTSNLFLSMKMRLVRSRTRSRFFMIWGTKEKV